MVFLYITLLCLIIFALLFYIPGYTSLIKDKNGHSFPDSIASLEKVNLGGRQQWILLRGVNTANPVILFLHGGPGTSDMGLLRKYMRELEKHFVVVTWDQRGAGKSFAANKPNSSMNINQFVLDAHELTEMLLTRFGQKKIFLAGHSWGSVLGILSVRKSPELFYAYVGIGQVADMAENEILSYDWTLEQAKNANDKRSVKKLSAIGTPPYTGNWRKKFMTERRYLGKFGGEVYNNTKGAFPLVIGCLIRSTEYTIRDKVNFFRGIFTTVKLLLPELLKINLMEIAPSLKVPVYFILGKHDFEVPSVLAEQYFNMLDAPHKELIWFENSAHMPHIEENEKFIGLMINRVLPENCAEKTDVPIEYYR